MRRREFLGLAAIGALAAACTPPAPTADEPTDTPSTGLGDDKVTLVVWDQNGGDVLAALNRDFSAQYPQVTIRREPKSYVEVRSALTGVGRQPDVVQVNQGHADMGELAPQLRALDKYADVFAWPKRFPQELLDVNSVSDDTFGSGELYGLSQTTEIIGFFYNSAKLASLKLKLPATWADFVELLGTIKDKDELPIAFGNKDLWPAIHAFGMLQVQLVGAQSARDLVFGADGATWRTEDNESAAATLRDWVTEGYLTADPNVVPYTQAIDDFAAGTGVFLPASSAQAGRLQRAMGGDVRFMLPPPAKKNDPPLTVAGQGLAWCITKASRHGDVAAAYVDFVTSGHAADRLVKAGVLPTMAAESAEPQANSAFADIVAGWSRLVEDNGLVPYLDYAGPDFYSPLTAGLYELLAGTKSAAAVMDALQDAYADLS